MFIIYTIYVYISLNTIPVPIITDLSNRSVPLSISTSALGTLVPDETLIQNHYDLFTRFSV